MEGQQTIVLKNLPITTRNYTVIDTVTGKPVDNTTYSLTIAPHVIEKLYELKRINEEKKQQASIRQQYDRESLTSAYTPQDNSVFTPLNMNEYIDFRDVNSSSAEYKDQTEDNAETNSPVQKVETMQSDGILGRVTARVPEKEKKEITIDEPPKPELDYITADTYQQTSNYEYEIPPLVDNSSSTETDNSIFTPYDNSSFNPEMAQAYNEYPSPVTHTNEGNMQETENRVNQTSRSRNVKQKKYERIELSQGEINAGRGVAWLAYILFFIPLLLKGKNRFVRIHANEGLDLNIAELIGVALLVPFFVIKDLAGTTELIVYALAILGAVILGVCAITIIPVMIGAMCGAQFKIPWLLRKRLIKVDVN